MSECRPPRPTPRDRFRLTRGRPGTIPGEATKTEDGRTRVEVRLENETVWLTQAQMAELFESSIPNVSIHIRNIFKEGELQQNSVVKEFLTTAADGKNYRTRFYNLDVIISAGYRVKWMAERLRMGTSGYVNHLLYQRRKAGKG